MTTLSYNELLDRVAQTVSGLFTTRKAPLVNKKVKLPSGEVTEVAEIDMEEVKKENPIYLQNLNKSIQNPSSRPGRG